jgi:hypothetical protein
MRRPISLTAFGIVSLFLAVLTLLGEFQVLAHLILARPASAAAGAERVHAIPYPISLSLAVLGCVAGLVLALAGLNMLRRRFVARRLAIGYALYAIPATVLTFIVQYAYQFAPRIAAVAGREPQIYRSMKADCTLAAVVMLSSLIFPALLLWLMSRRSIVDALAAPQPKSPQEDDLEVEAFQPIALTPRPRRRKAA